MIAIINVKRLTEYSAMVEMSQQDFDAYQKALDGGGPSEKSSKVQLNNKIKSDDWQDDSLLEVELEASDDCDDARPEPSESALRCEREILDP